MLPASLRLKAWDLHLALYAAVSRSIANRIRIGEVTLAERLEHRLRRLVWRLAGPTRDESVSIRGHQLVLADAATPPAPWMIAGKHDDVVMQWIDRFLWPGDVAIDVGAHVGYFTVAMARRVGVEGRVFAFEPDDGNRALLSANCRLNDYSHVHIAPHAVTERPGPVELHHSAIGNARHSLVPDVQTRSVSELAATSLDTFLEGADAGDIRFIKIDVEGAEARVVRGASQTISANPGAVLAFEFWPTGIRACGDDPVALLATLSAKGFSLYRSLAESPIAQSDIETMTRRLETTRQYVNVLALRQ